MKLAFVSGALALVTTFFTFTTGAALADCVRVKVNPSCWGDTCVTRCAAGQQRFSSALSQRVSFGQRTLGKRKRHH